MSLKALEMTPLDKFVNAPVAIGAVTSPAWLEPLAQISQIAAYLLPIVGLTWLVIQIAYKTGLALGLWGRKVL